MFGDLRALQDEGGFLRSGISVAGSFPYFHCELRAQYPSVAWLKVPSQDKERGVWITDINVSILGDNDLKRSKYQRLCHEGISLVKLRTGSLNPNPVPQTRCGLVWP